MRVGHRLRLTTWRLHNGPLLSGCVPRWPWLFLSAGWSAGSEDSSRVCRLWSVLRWRPVSPICTTATTVWYQLLVVDQIPTSLLPTSLLPTSLLPTSLLPTSLLPSFSSFLSFSLSLALSLSLSPSLSLPLPASLPASLPLPPSLPLFPPSLILVRCRTALLILFSRSHWPSIHKHNSSVWREAVSADVCTSTLEPPPVILSLFLLSRFLSTDGSK